MTVKQLRDELAKHPDNMDVFIDVPVYCDFGYVPVNSIEKKDIRFYEPGNKDCEAFEECIVISEG